jgi:two-component system sensor histidine kinase/response regulator
MSDTILYVDDDEANLFVLQTACGRDLKVITAQSGQAALEIMREQEIAVLLADQRMPGMTGVELFEQTKSEFPDVVRVLISAYSDFQDATAAINRGHVQRFLRKPWVIEELKANLREALEAYRTTRKVKLLEQRLRETERVYALGVVAAGIAHELRNPIAAVATSLSLLRDELAGLLSSVDPAGPLSTTLSELVLSVADARQGIQQITDITRGIELSQRRHDSEDQADLSEIARLTLASLQGELRRRAQLDVLIEPLPFVRGAKAKLGQVVLNVVVNVMQALPARPRSQNRVRISLYREGPNARLEVESNGGSLADPGAQRLFDPFDAEQGSGSGLGLAISREIIEEVGGALKLAGGDQSTCFCVLVPLVSLAAQGASTSAA